MNATATITLTVSGDTYKARTWLKENGWKFNGDSKSWSLSGLVPSVNTMTGDDGFGRNGSYIGSMATIRSRIACYAKSERFELVAE